MTRVRRKPTNSQGAPSATFVGPFGTLRSWQVGVTGDRLPGPATGTVSRGLPLPMPEEDADGNCLELEELGQRQPMAPAVGNDQSTTAADVDRDLVVGVRAAIPSITKALVESIDVLEFRSNPIPAVISFPPTS